MVDLNDEIGSSTNKSKKVTAIKNRIPKLASLVKDQHMRTKAAQAVRLRFGLLEEESIHDRIHAT